MTHCRHISFLYTSAGFANVHLVSAFGAGGEFLDVPFSKAMTEGGNAFGFCLTANSATKGLRTLFQAGWGSLFNNFKTVVNFWDKVALVFSSATAFVEGISVLFAGGQDCCTCVIV